MTRAAFLAALLTGASFVPALAAPPGVPSAVTPFAAEIRYVTRCEPVFVERRGRFGRTTREQRGERCRRVWVPETSRGAPPGTYPYYR